MANVVLCDPHAGAHSADWMLTHFTDGETKGMCDERFVAYCLAVIEAVSEAEATETAAEAERRLSNANPPTPGRSSRKSKREAERPESQPQNDNAEPSTVTMPEDDFGNPDGTMIEQPSETPEGTEA